MKKQYILISIIVIIIVGIICFFTIPRIDYKYDSKSDSYYVNYVYGNASEYVIKEEINGKPVTRIGARAFYQKTRLKRVVLSDSVTKIGRLSFSGCKALEEINLNRVIEIDRNAFEECSSLKKVELSCEHILGSTFYDCTSLEEVVLNNTISIGSYAFANTKIKSITLPETTKNVYYNAFDLIDSLTSIKVLSTYLANNEYLISLGICEFEEVN